MTISTHTQMVDEILNTISLSQDPIQALRNAFDRIPFLRSYLSSSVDSEFVTFDPADVHYSNHDFHRSLAGAHLINKGTFKTFTQVLFGQDVPENVKKTSFKNLMELLYVPEANILYAILTKDISSIYPELTHEVISTALGAPNEPAT